MRKTSVGFSLLFFFCILLDNTIAKSVEIRIMSPLNPKFVAKGYKRIYLADFYVTGTQDVDKNVNINVNKEVKETLKSEFVDRSAYDIVDLKVEYAPAKAPEEFLNDPSFWLSQNITDRQGSLILVGAIEFSNHEKGGLVTERVTNPRTGMERDVTTSQDRLQIVLAVNLYLLDAKTGQKLFQEDFKEEEVYNDVSNVSLPLFYDVFDRIAPKVVGVLVPYRVGGSRILLEP